jgi:hypothetical protein
MVLFTATCPQGHRDAQWSQSQGNVVPSSFQIVCGVCILQSARRPLATTAPQPQAIPAVPLVLRGYRWAKAVVGT